MEPYIVKEIGKEHEGRTYKFPIGVLAENVKTDDNHQFMTAAEKKAVENLGKLGDAAYYGVANDDETNDTSCLVTAAVAYQHGEEIDKINKDLETRLPGGVGIEWDGTDFWGTAADGVKKKLGKPVIELTLITHNTEGDDGWGLAVIVIPEGYTTLEAALTDGSGCIYAYSEEDTDNTNHEIGVLDTEAKTFDISGYKRIGIRTQGYLTANGKVMAKLYG